DEIDDFARILFFCREVIDCDVRTFACKGDRGGPPDSRIAAGDQRLAAAQQAVSAISPFAMIGFGMHARSEPRPWLRLRIEWRFRIGLARAWSLGGIEQGREPGAF